ncbi:MAG: ABC transporter substrate-binding protein [Actinobacteria bacterium]|nr:ABC transporter substrate-binding protein [Actinomycetota bacterium]
MPIRSRPVSTIVVILVCLLAAACGARFPRETAVGAGSTAAPAAAPAESDPGVAVPGEPAPGAAPSAPAAGGATTTAPRTAAPAPTAGGGGVPAGAAPRAAESDPGPAPGVSATSVKIGYLLPITGAAPVPASFDKGARVYWNYVRDQLGGIPVGGQKRNVEIVIEDTQSDANVGKDKARKLIEQDKVFLIVVLDRLENQQAIGAFLDARKFPNIAIQAPAGLDKSQEWTFGVTIDHGVQGVLIADYLVKVHKASKLAVVHENTPVLTPGVTAFTRQVEKLGAQVVYSKSIDGQNNDFSSEALQLAGSGATATWLYMAPTPAAKLANQADAAGHHPVWFANAISWNFDLIFTVGRKALAGARAFSPWPPLSDPRTSTYQQEYRRQNPADIPDDLGIVGWGVGEIVGGGLQAVQGPLGQNSFRLAMQNLQLRPTLWNPLSFGPGVRQGGNSVAIYRESDGRWTLERDFTSSI